MMILGIVCIVVVIGGLVLYEPFFSKRRTLDRKTGCPIEGPDSKTVVLIDQTDNFTPVQAADIQNKLKAYKDNVPRFGEFVVYTIKDRSNSIPAPIIRVCNPGNEDDINELFESSVQITRKWKESFDGPIRKVLKDVLQPMSSKTSPIIETIQAVTVSEFGPAKMNNKGKELIVVSDLLQHSGALSHYGRKYNIGTFIKSRSFSKLGVDLRDVEVDFLYLYRDTQKADQNSEHQNFWIRLIQKQGGSVRRVYTVSG